VIEKNFVIPFVSDLALREKQIQQNYRPIIAVHKWFARRPGTLFRALLLSEFNDAPVSETFYLCNDHSGITVADPFMGGGSPLIEANRIGCDVVGYDINPMSFWVVKEELEYLDLKEYEKSAIALRKNLQKGIGNLYQTKCEKCSSDAQAKYFLWMKTTTCQHCSKTFDLSPGYIVAENKRHPNYIVLCKACGAIKEVQDKKKPGKCLSCKKAISLTGTVSYRSAICSHCGKNNTFPGPDPEPPAHRLFTIEYYCPICKPLHVGRFFKAPDVDDLAKVAVAEERVKALKMRFIPEDPIPPGDETDRLLRWGYRYYREMFNTRQLLGLELSSRFISTIKDQRVKFALATNLSDLLRYQNMLCRYDTMALKSLDIFSIHGFPVGLIQCESNFMGIPNGGGTNVGSGGWSNIIEKFSKAKSYCLNPFEIKHSSGRKMIVPVIGEWIGDVRPGHNDGRRIELNCKSSTTACLSPNSFDAVFTDPPYFGNVQYAELMDFCYVWLKKLIGSEVPVFQAVTTRNEAELTGNVNMGRDLTHFTSGLADTFTGFASALKPGGPFAFTFHHNQLDAYIPVVVAILDAGLVCTVALPCPAEMGASIHINGTTSSIVDTVFVCRSTGTILRRLLFDTPQAIAGFVAEDHSQLAKVYAPSQGDLRCLLYGHIARLAVWRFRSTWIKTESVQMKMTTVKQFFQTVAISEVLSHLDSIISKSPARQSWQAMEQTAEYGGTSLEVSF
jgi:putative DNA methylase